MFARFTFFAACLGILILTSSLRAAPVPPSLQGVLINSKEMVGIFNNQMPSIASKNGLNGGSLDVMFPVNRIPIRVGLPTNAIQENDVFCRAMGFGCLLVSVTENPEDTTLYLENGPSGIVRSARSDGLGFQTYSGSRLPPVNPWFERVFFAQSWKDAYLYHREKKMPGDLNDGPTLFKRDREWIQSFLQGALKGKGDGIETHSFVSQVMKRPRTFSALSEYMGQAQRMKPSEQVNQVRNALEAAISAGLLLTIDTFTKISDSGSPMYPYLNDHLTRPGSLLNLDRLYNQLSKVSRWPRIQHLTVAKREQMDPLFNQKASKGYVAHAIYEPTENAIYIDMTRPFFENVYTLYHELWHVAAFHSEKVNIYRDEIQAILRLPRTEETQELIRHTVLRFFAEHELLAIDQANRLFRATGHFAAQWGGPLPSIQSWHDSHFGSHEELNLFIPREMRKVKSVAAEFQTPMPKVSLWNLRRMVIPEFVELAIKDKNTDRTIRNREQAYAGKMSLSVNLDQFLLEKSTGHVATFRATYLPELVRINPETLMQSREILGSTYGVREGVEMSCTDVSTMVAAMGEYVRYGFPFPFQIENGYVKCAAPVGGLPEKPIRLHVRTGLPSLELLKLDASK